MLETMDPPQKQPEESSHSKLDVFFRQLTQITYDQAWDELNRRDISEVAYLEDELPKADLIQLAKDKLQDVAVKAQVEGK